MPQTDRELLMRMMDGLASLRSSVSGVGEKVTGVGSKLDGVIERMDRQDVELRERRIEVNERLAIYDKRLDIMAGDVTRLQEQREALRRDLDAEVVRGKLRDARLLSLALKVAGGSVAASTAIGAALKWAV